MKNSFNKKLTVITFDTEKNKMEKELPKRKEIRLKQYDYSSPGAYFITICTENRKNYFWEGAFDPQLFAWNTVGANCVRPHTIM